MRRRLARWLRVLAAALDPPRPVQVWPPITVTSTGTNGAYYVWEED